MTYTSMPITDPYLVRPGDTLGNVAARVGQTVRELQRLNGLPAPDRLRIGQTLYLSPQTAFGVSAVFLDALRHPIRNLEFRCTYDDKTVAGVTDATGIMPRQVVRSAKSVLVISIKDSQGNWVTLYDKPFGHGQKLLNFVSNAIVVDGKTEPHPAGAPAVRPPPSPRPADHRGSPPALPPAAQGEPAKNNPVIRKQSRKGPQGQPVIAVDIDLPANLLALFHNYRGGDIRAEDWNRIAGKIDCEPAVLQAIAHVESGGRNSFWRLNHGNGAHVPALLFERHYFSHLTRRRYDPSHPDLSWPYGYRKNAQLGNADRNLHDGRIDDDDVYGNYARGYLRLINAYRLDPEAALKSCSWGKFQIMGANHRTCGYDDILDFVGQMCSSESGQMAIVGGYIRNKPRAWKDPKNKSLDKEISLWNAVKNKNWEAIAFNYNGPDYRKYSYDRKLRAAYQRYSRV